MAKKYLSTYKNEIKSEIFQKTRRSEPNALTPEGGFSATIFDLENPDKRINSKRKIKGVIFELKDDAKILDIADKKDFDTMRKEYPFEDDSIDYETLALSYDGIYLHYTYSDKSRLYDVDILHLFNLNCISHYQSVVLSGGLIKEISSPKKIEKPKPEFFEFVRYADEYFWEFLREEDEKMLNDLTYEAYIKYTGDLKTAICTDIITNFSLELRNLVKAYGFREAFWIVIAVIANLLKIYYRFNKDKIEKLKKTIPE